MTIVEALRQLRNDLKAWTTNNLRTKLNKNLGDSESGKILAINSTGDIVTASVDNNNPTLSWNTTSTIGTIGNTDLTVSMPANPDTDTTYDLTASASATNGNVKINLTAGGSGSGTDSVSISGSGATKVTTNANGAISIGVDTATASVAGVAKIGYTESDRNYAVKLSNNDQMYVTVPWTDTNTNTTYSTATSDTAGLVKIGYSENNKNYAVKLSNGQMYVTVPWTDTDTDNDTKVTSVDNHYMPSADTNSVLSVDASSTTAATWGSTQLVTGVNIARDAKGHITDLTLDSIKMPANPNVDTWRAIQLEGTEKLSGGISTKPLNIKAGYNMSISENDGTFTFTATNTDTNVSSFTTTSDVYYLTGSKNSANNTGTLAKRTDVFVDTNGIVNAVGYNATSDARLKTNFEQFSSEQSILDLPIYKFDFIDGPENQIGCKAQDLQKICPELVTEREDGYLLIKESKLVYLLLEEVKKLKNTIDYLTNGGN